MSTQDQPHTLAELGERIFGTPAAVEATMAPPASEPQSSPTPRDEIAQRYLQKPPEPVVIEPPAHIAEMRKAAETPADRMFKPIALQPVADMMTGATVPADVPPEVRQAVAIELSLVARDTGLSAEDIAELRREAPAYRELTPEQVQAKRVEATQLLVEEFGAEKATAAMDAAHALAIRDPRMKALLEHTGLGNSPQLVLKLAREGLRQRAAGKLK